MDSRHQLVDADTGEVIVAKLEVADTFWRRFRGLQFRPKLAADEGLLLTPCRSIHTHWMRFSIDVALLDEDGYVLAVYISVPPWRIIGRVKSTRSIVETMSGSLAGRLRMGTRVEVRSSTGDHCAGARSASCR
jgi:uncharacterized protein